MLTKSISQNFRVRLQLYECASSFQEVKGITGSVEQLLLANDSLPR